MATISTKINEPKSFDEIQQEEKDSGLLQAVGELNSNIRSLSAHIGKIIDRKETSEDKKLKENKVELSEAQLRRAKLGLAREQQAYQKSTTNISAKSSHSKTDEDSVSMKYVAASALTGGIVNPVILKSLTNVFDSNGIGKPANNNVSAILNPFSRTSGKSSSALQENPNEKLHNKLDQIISAIKDKSKSPNEAKKEENENLLTKVLKAALAGAVGMLALDKLIGNTNNVVLNTLKQYGPAMIAGFALYGWKGAMVGLALQMLGEATGIIPTTQEKATLVTLASQKVANLLSRAGVKFKEKDIKLATAGMMLGGWKGLAAAFILDSITRIGEIDENEAKETIFDVGAKKAAALINEVFGKDTVTENEVKMAAAGAIFGGWKGAVAGYTLAVVGEALGYIPKGNKAKKDIDPDSDDVEHKAGISTIMGRNAFRWTMAGMMLGGWKGAVTGYSLHKIAKIAGFIPSDDGAKNEIDIQADKAAQIINNAVSANVITGEQLQLTVAGLMLGGWKGMVAGYLLGSNSFKSTLKAFEEDGIKGLLALANNSITEIKKGTILEGIPNEVIAGAIAGGMLGSTGGPVGAVVGAIIGAAGGYVFKMFEDRNVPRKHGIDTEYSASKKTWVIAGTDKSWSDFREAVEEEYQGKIDEKHKEGYWTKKELDEITLQRIRETKPSKAMSDGEVLESTLGSVLDYSKGLIGKTKDSIAEIFSGPGTANEQKIKKFLEQLLKGKIIEGSWTSGYRVKNQKLYDNVFKKEEEKKMLGLLFNRNNWKNLEDRGKEIFFEQVINKVITPRDKNKNIYSEKQLATNNVDTRVVLINPERTGKIEQQNQTTIKQGEETNSLLSNIDKHLESLVKKEENKKDNNVVVNYSNINQMIGDAVGLNGGHQSSFGVM